MKIHFYVKQALLNIQNSNSMGNFNISGIVLKYIFIYMEIFSYIIQKKKQVIAKPYYLLF